MEQEVDQLNVLRGRIEDLMERLDVAAKEKEVALMEAEAALPSFWEDTRKAQAVMSRLSAEKETARTWRDLEKRTQDLVDLVALAAEEKDESVREEVCRDIVEIDSGLGKLEFNLLFRGEFDSRNAILAIHAGAGGTESQDWAEIMMRMYMRWAERRRYKTELLDSSAGTEAGIKSAVIEVKGDHAYGRLRSENGVHRLVRLSPFDFDHARHTSFALVEVLPEAEEDVDMQIPETDLKIEAFRSSGPGGQHMQKTSSAVRITHVPTGIVSMCQSQRSQLRNREVAMRILYARVLELDLKKKAEEQAKFKGERIDAGWGNQIRSYVLHPYHMVKDHRTSQETSNTDAVLDGDLDAFVEAYLRSRIGEEK
ncbi:MAG: peptide chain release factor 2 [Dehalococcoidia bacterium]|nr:peptide chain release factor 2 [Dehalococcoidia bacterium]